MIGLRSQRKLAGSAVLAALLWLVQWSVSATPKDEDLFLRSEDMRTVLFGNLEAGRSVFVSAGVKRTLTGSLDRDGFVAMEASGTGLTRERLDGVPGFGLMRVVTETSSLLGYQWSRNAFYAALYAGPELHHEQLTVAALAGRWSKPRLGGRLLGELWANPSRDTLLTATVQAGSARGSLWARASAGYRLWRNLYVGPEAVLYMTPTYRETKIGAHVTGLDLGILHLRVSGGWQHQEDRRHVSPYVGVTSWMRL